MKPIQYLLSILLVALLINVNQCLAAKILDRPQGQRTQCEQIYMNAEQPKTISTAFYAANRICHYGGGMHVLRQTITSKGSDEPRSIIFTCIGSNSNNVIFTCLFSLSLGDY